jgi:ubiquinone/menaquinone biosynthesis C-methylase UbiE
LKNTDNNFTNKNSNTNNHWKQIQGPIFIGRSWEEYIKMFNLNLDALHDDKILDCAAGASSFTPHMAKKGLDVTAVDLMYNNDPDVLCKKSKEHLEALVESLRKVDDNFVWDFFKDLKDLKNHRNKASKEFISDYRINKGKRYIAADLINLPFEDDSFSLVLCSHLLFIYDHRLDYKFHLKAVKEMLRVTSGELRIYPLIRSKGKNSIFLKPLMNDINGAEIEILNVNYEFRKGGNEMIRIVKSN